MPYNAHMTTNQLVRVFGTKSAIAAFLGITRQSVSEWGQQVPKLRQYELREKRPSLDRELRKAGK